MIEMKYATRVKCLAALLLAVALSIALAAHFRPESATLFLGLGLIPVVGILAAIVAMHARRRLDDDT